MWPNWFIRRFNKTRDRQYARNIKFLLLLISLLTIGAVVAQPGERIPLGGHFDPPPLKESEIDKLALWWFAPFLSGGGYCSEAITFVTGLHGVVPLGISQHGDAFSWDFLDGLPPDTQDLLQDLLYHPIDREKAIIVCHSEPGAWTPALFETPPCPLGGAQYLIGRTMFETDRIPKGWADRCNEIMDEIWVPTEFHRQTFQESGVLAHKLVVMPEPIDTTFWHPKKAGRVMKLPRRKLDRRDVCDDQGHCHAHRTEKGPNCFAFLSVFKWEARKGWDILLRAFIEEFDAHRDHVCLYIKTAHFHSEEEFQATIAEFAQSELGMSSQDWETRIPTIHVLPLDIPTSRMPSLYRSVDCVVIPSRGEGWGRPHVEAMAMGLPLIATNWSGPTAYMTESNSFPLRIDGLEPVSSGPWRGHMWAKPSVTHLRELMRQVYNDPKAAKAIGKVAQMEISSKYGVPQVTSLVVQRLAVIKERLKARARAQALSGTFTEESSMDAEAAAIVRNGRLDMMDGDL